MKKNLFKAAAAALCVMLLLAQAPVSALTAQGYPDSYSQEKLLAFWQQESPEGLTNGEAVYAIDTWNFTPEHYNYGAGHGSYDGSWVTDLVNYDYGGDTFQFHFGYREPVWMMAEIQPGVFIHADGYEYAFPDLYGDLDLSGTNLGSVTPLYFMDGVNEMTSSHIASVCLNNCASLSFVEIGRQEHLESVTALGCPRLVRFSVTDCACRRIDFKTTALDKSLSLGVLGEGSVGADFTSESGTVIAYPQNGGFIGWYRNGEMIGAEQSMSLLEGGRLTAVFAGDADGDGLVDSGDALMIMRSSLGMLDASGFASADVNSDGVVDSADALTIMRLSLGLL